MARRPALERGEHSHHRWHPGQDRIADVDIEKAIRTRQSVSRVTQDPVPREDIERILESAVHAPNHKITEPWRFHVFVGKGRGELARARAEMARLQAEAEGEDDDMAAGRISRERKKAFRAPVVIAVVALAGRDEVETLENYAACSAAVQNMLLTAHALGLGAIWRTGPVAYHEHMRKFFGLNDGDQVVAHLYLGYPDMGERSRRRKPAPELTVWHDG
jgi:nitroreductase